MQNYNFFLIPQNFTAFFVLKILKITFGTAPDYCYFCTMQFRTEIQIPKNQGIIHPFRPVVTFGSCFAENIACRMRRALWPAINPAGVLYNPLSIADAIDILLDDNGPDTFCNSLFRFDGTYRSWAFDSGTAASDLNGMERIYLNMRESLLRSLRKGGTLIVTFGTAWCYFLNEGDRLVANCHKQPAALFTRRRIEIAEITARWNAMTEKLTGLFPGINLLFTVSPVRHLKDGLVENNLSKATLLLAVQELCRHPSCHYFPAYEIVNDDLRDYRFYASDMVHPSDTAVDYIWERFKETYLDAEGLRMVEEGEKMYRRLKHRPMLPDSIEGKRFARQTETAFDTFTKKYPDALHDKDEIKAI